MLKLIKNNSYQIIGILGVLLLFFLSLNNSFFWDTTQLGAKHATFYLSDNFSSILLPGEMDSGHIPAFGFYLGLIWQVFGRTLIVSHLAMLPFIIGIFWQLNLLIKQYFKKEHFGIVFLLLLLDPTLLSQITLISPDICLVFFFLLGWNGILKHKKTIILVSIFCLFLTSMRGMMVAFCLYLMDIFYHINFKESFKNIFQKIAKKSLVYIPSVLLFLAFNIYHYYEKGWIIYHEGSPWAACFEKVDVKGFIFNLGILSWRMIDFGRIGIWLVFFILILKFRKKIFENKKTKALLLIFVCFLIILPSNMVWAKNLLAHRYLIPIFLTFAVFCASILFNSNINNRLRKILTSVWLIVLITGNFWIYPDKLSQGWDATLAHLPYYKLRTNALNYLEKEDIAIKNVASFFPNKAVIDYLDLNENYSSFSNFTENSNYVLYSNIFNIEDHIYDELTANYKMIKEFKKLNVFIKIYKKQTLN